VVAGKRLEGAFFASVAYKYGLGGRVPTYEETLTLHLNLPQLDNAESFREFTVAACAGPAGSLPFSWIDAAITNPADANKWKNWDLRRGYSP
jgi:hypothetical protein